LAAHSVYVLTLPRPECGRRGITPTFTYVIEREGKIEGAWGIKKAKKLSERVCGVTENFFLPFNFVRVLYFVAVALHYTVFCEPKEL
jgi:hypothetical protein